MKNIIFWEDVLEKTPESYKKWFEEERKYLRKNILKNNKVLEVGCGEGRSIRDIIDITQNVTGIDNDEDAVKHAKYHFKKYPEVKILLANGRNHPFMDNSFDFVICMTTFANFGEDKIKTLNEMKRVVKKEGFIIISVFSENAFEERMKVYKKLNAPIKEIRGTTVIFDESLGSNTSEQFSLVQLKELFNKVKLKLIEVEKLSIAYICKLNKN